MRKFIRLVVFPSIVGISGCQTAPVGIKPHKPHVHPPLPLFRESVQAQSDYSDVLNHPWVEGQPGVPTLTYVMCDDIRSVGPMGEQYGEILTEIQKEIPIATPCQFYSLLFLPESDPYQIVKRQHVGDNRYGFPVYLEIHKWEADLDEVSAYYGDRFDYMIGEVGYHRTPIHGLDFGERATFVQLYEGQGVVYALYLDSLADEANSLLPIVEACSRFPP